MSREQQNPKAKLIYQVSIYDCTIAEVKQTLFDGEVDINYVDGTGNTVLITAMMGYLRVKNTEEEASRKELVEYLINKGADTNIVQKVLYMNSTLENRISAIKDLLLPHITDIETNVINVIRSEITLKTDAELLSSEESILLNQAIDDISLYKQMKEDGVVEVEDPAHHNAIKEEESTPLLGHADSKSGILHNLGQWASSVFLVGDGLDKDKKRQ